MREYININNIYPDYLESENYLILSKEWTRQDFDNYYKNYDSSKNELPLGHIYKNELEKDIGKKFIYLHNKKYDCTLMSNHSTEDMTCKFFLDNAFGDVLIFGIGLGYTVFPLLKDKNIKSIKIIENDPELINLVGKYLNKFDDDKKLKIIHADAFTYYRDLNNKFDTVWFDIWGNLFKSTLDEIYYFYKVYRKNLRDENSLILSWCENEIKDFFYKNYASPGA